MGDSVLRLTVWLRTISAGEESKSTGCECSSGDEQIGEERTKTPSV